MANIMVKVRNLDIHNMLFLLIMGRPFPIKQILVANAELDRRTPPFVGRGATTDVVTLVFVDFLGFFFLRFFEFFFAFLFFNLFLFFIFFFFVKFISNIFLFHSILICKDHIGLLYILQSLEVLWLPAQIY